MASPLAELSSNLPSLRTSQRSASLKSAPATPGISPGGRHFRAAEFELAALLPLCDEVTSYVDALAAAAGSRSKTAALVETLDGRLTSLRHASMAVPTVDMDTAAQQDCGEGVVLRRQLWEALDFLQRAVNAARRCRDDDVPPSPACVEAQRAQGEALATPLRRARSLPGATPERTPASALRGDCPSTPWGEFASKTPLPGAPGGVYAGGDFGDAPDALAASTPAATPLPRMGSLALTPVRESEDTPEGTDNAPTPHQLALTPLPAAEMAGAAETPLPATRFALSSPAAAAFARAMTLHLQIPPSPLAEQGAAPDATPDSVLLAGSLFAAMSLERDTSLAAEAVVPEPEAAPIAEEEAAVVVAQPPPVVAAVAPRGLHPVLWLLKTVLVVGVSAAAGAAMALHHTRQQQLAAVVVTMEPVPVAFSEPEEKAAAKTKA